MVREVKSGSTVKAKYQYLADGTKQQVRDASGANGYDYLGGLTLVKSGGTTTPEAAFAEGVIRGSEVMFFEKDHLGSVRAVLNSSGQVLERNDYYPFGLRHSNASHPISAGNRFKFNGKEDQVTGDLKHLDYGWRMYDPQIGRWLKQDRFAEKYYPQSPYNYGLNNPALYIDIKGDSTRVYTETNSNHGAGHAWISTGEGENIKVYTYGRYDGTNKSSMPNGLRNGPGVLVKLEGKDAIAFNKSELTNDMKQFTIADVDDKVIDDYFDQKLNSSKVTVSSEDSKYKDHPNAKVIDEYSLLKNNCTTTVSDALNNAGSKTLSIPTYTYIQGGVPISNGIRYERFIIPSSLQNHLLKNHNR